MLNRQIAIAWNKIDLILAILSSWYFGLYSNSVILYVFCNVHLRYQIASPEFSFLYVQDYCRHSSQNAVYDTLSKELAKLLYLSCRSMCRMTNALNWDSVQNLCLAIKSMLSTTSCVCVILDSLKIHLFFQWAVIQTSIKNRNYVL